jgi:hypothetical protein
MQSFGWTQLAILLQIVSYFVGYGLSAQIDFEPYSLLQRELLVAFFPLDHNTKNFAPFYDDVLSERCRNELSLDCYSALPFYNSSHGFLLSIVSLGMHCLLEGVMEALRFREKVYFLMGKPASLYRSKSEAGHFPSSRLGRGSSQRR